MTKRVKSAMMRYGLGLAAFALTILIAIIFRRYSIRIDLSLLVILVLIGVSWYGGKGPGLMVLILVELTTIANALLGRATQPITTRYIVTQFNVMLLFVLLIVLTAGRRENERRLREQREWLQLTLSSIGIAVIATDLEGKINFVNPAAAATTGWAQSQAVGHSLDEVFQIVDEESHQRIVVSVSKAGSFDAPPSRSGYRAETAHEEKAKNLILVSQDGAKRPVDYSIAPISNRAGKITGAVLVFRDITERKRAEEALRESEERYRIVAETATDVIITIDEESRILFVNRAVDKVFGYSSQELLGQQLTILMPEYLRQVHRAGIKRYLDTGERHITWEGVELPGLHKTGKEISLEISFAEFIKEGHQFFIGVIRDVTDRKRAEEALRIKNEEMVAMSQQLWQAAKLATMGELAASIAHELNNPLSSVSLRVESLLEEVPPASPQYQDLQIIEQELERMSDLVANLLQFVRRSHTQISTLDLREEINNTLQLIDNHLRNRRITVVREFASEVPMIHADRQQLRQLLLNLISNASDAMPEGGTLTISLRVVNREGEKNVSLEIADSGCGISPEDMPRLMEPFYTTKPEGKGTGLGLSICRRIIQDHKGEIDIMSEAGRGTTVRITLPVNGRGNGEFV
ncbi:MAG: PAS domain S-box protein [Blastocatellia bacterium]|nr:PAS domain S-box protein [Blastocatellia bacterium]